MSETRADAACGHNVFDVPELHQDNAADHAMDKLVYELYGLNEEEISIVEGGSA
jgi:hypothetical protein